MCFSHDILSISSQSERNAFLFRLTGEDIRVRDVEALAWLLSVRAKTGIQEVRLHSPCSSTSPSWSKLIVIVSARPDTDPAPFRSRILIVSSVMLGTPPSSRPSLEAQNSGHRRSLSQTFHLGFKDEQHFARPRSAEEGDSGGVLSNSRRKGTEA